MIATVLLKDDTVGTLTTDTEELDGMTVTVNTGDENGNPIQKTGEVKAVLETRHEWN